MCSERCGDDDHVSSNVCSIKECSRSKHSPRMPICGVGDEDPRLCSASNVGPHESERKETTKNRDGRGNAAYCTSYKPSPQCSPGACESSFSGTLDRAFAEMCSGSFPETPSFPCPRTRGG